jgi:dTDP-4-dehydrorhamnose 3,5-epimerase
MQFIETAVAGAYIVEPQVRGDERGFFARLWCQEEFAAHGLAAVFVQCNASLSTERGTLRGLHYQVAPFEEVKLVRCIRGAVFDVFVDLRPQSGSYMRWAGVELTADNRRAVYVPGGCAHGYLTLVDNTEVEYPVSQSYQPAAERGLRWNDPSVDIEWPFAPCSLSVKDRSWPDYTP